MEDFIGSILLSTTLFPRKEAQGTKVLLLKSPGCQARKGASKAIGEQVFFDGVDAVLDAGSMFHAIAASFLRFCAKQKSQRPRTPDLGAWPSCYCRNTRHIVYGFGCYAFLLASSSASGRLSRPWRCTIKRVLTELMMAAISR